MLVGLAAEQMPVAAAVAISVDTGLVRILNNGVTGRLAIQAAVAVQAGPILPLVLSPTRRAIKRAMEHLLFMPRSRARSMHLVTLRSTVIRPTTF